MHHCVAPMGRASRRNEQRTNERTAVASSTATRLPRPTSITHPHRNARQCDPDNGTSREQLANRTNGQPSSAAAHIGALARPQSTLRVVARVTCHPPRLHPTPASLRRMRHICSPIVPVCWFSTAVASDCRRQLETLPSLSSQPLPSPWPTLAPLPPMRRSATSWRPATWCVMRAPSADSPPSTSSTVISRPCCEVLSQASSSRSRSVQCSCAAVRCGARSTCARGGC